MGQIHAAPRRRALRHLYREVNSLGIDCCGGGDYGRKVAQSCEITQKEAKDNGKNGTDEY